MLILLAVALQSCQSYNHKLYTKGTLNSSNTESINGEYASQPILAVMTKFHPFPMDKHIDSSLLLSLDRSLNTNNIDYGILNHYTFSIQVFDNKRVSIKCLQGGRCLKTYDLEVQLKSDGFLYLKNRNVRPILIPFICGAIDVTKLRFSRDSEGDLIVDKTNHRSGAFLFIAFFSVSNTESRCIYKKIKPLS